MICQLTSLREVLSLFIKHHLGEFIPMILGLKNPKNNENIMHCLAKNELLDTAKKLIETIKKNSDPINATKLMFARDSRSGNSAMMVMMTRRMYRSDSIENTAKINSLWYACVNDEVLSKCETIITDILAPNFLKKTIIHLCVQSKMSSLATRICFETSLHSKELLGFFNNPEFTPLKEIQDETYMVIFSFI